MTRALAFFVALVCTSAVDCPAPYVCELGACRSECRTDRDCAPGTTCVGAEGGGVCTLPSESACDRCPAPLVCSPATGCRAACSTDDDCLATQGCSATTCVDRPDEDAPADAAAPDAPAPVDAAPVDAAPVDAPSADVPPDAGSVYPAPELCTDDTVCEAAELCSSDFGTPGVCRARCDAHADCPGSACDAIGTRPELGCASLCVPGTQDGCPVGTSCRMTGYGGAIPGGPAAVTVCSRFLPSGGHGCSCENLDDSHECGAGLSCEQPDRGRQCLTICRVGDPCPTGGVCEATLRSVVRAGVEWGVCPATSAPIACP